MHLFIVLLLTLRALEEFSPRLCPLRCKPVITTTWAILIYRLIVRDEVALWIVRAAPEGTLELTAAALDEIARLTLRTFYTAWYRARVLTVRIAVTT